MILVDSNLLLYAFHQEVPEHEASIEWLERSLAEQSRVALPWLSILSFVRISSSNRIFRHAVPVAVAWRQVEAWLDAPSVWVPTPTERHRRVLATLVPHCAASSDLIQDAHLAALAIEHGLALCSTDGDFARFPGLRWIHPLRAEV